MHTFEIEIKSLLGSQERRDALLEKMRAIDPGLTLLSKNKQLNHYFIGGDLQKLSASLLQFFSAEAQERLSNLVTIAKEFSIRTRDKDGKVLFIVKASVDDSSSANGVRRMEFEESVPLSLSDLDQKVLDAGFTYQAKWSREREEYTVRDVSVCLDKNAGYGYLAEFEKMITDESQVESARDSILSLMKELEVEELPQDRLERMFAHYNAHWPEYFGTEKIFIIE